MDKNKQLRVYEGGLFPLEIKIVIVIITILLKIKVSNFNNNFHFSFISAMKEVIACINVYQGKSLKLV